MKLRNVLLVDDDDYVRFCLKRMAVWGAPTGYIIAGEAENGQEALELLSKQHFDLVISDIRMPKINGVELLAKIVENKLAPSVVFLSEHSEFEYARQGLLYGLFDYLVKPVEECDMKHLLERLAKRVPTAVSASTTEITSPAATLSLRDEAVLLQEYLLSGDNRSSDMAEILADKVVKAYSDNMPKAIGILNDNLLLLAQALREELAGIDKLIHWQSGAIFEKVHGQTGAAVRNSYLASLQQVVLQLAPYVRFSKCGSLIRKANSLIIENIDRKVTLGWLAEALFVNRTYFSELFKEKTGVNVVAYIAELKMQRAKILIAQGDMRIGEIADLLGYQDTDYFSRIFKQFAGCSPTEYRKQAFRAPG